MSASSLITLACAGHVLIDLPVFMGPVAMLVGWLWLVRRKDRRRQRAVGPDGRPEVAG